MQAPGDHNDQRAEVIPPSTATQNWSIHVSDVSEKFLHSKLVSIVIVEYIFFG